MTSSARASTPVGNFQTKRLGSLEIDHELECGGLHHRKVGGRVALENSGGIDAGLVIGGLEVGFVAHQATGRDELALKIDSRQHVASRQRDDQFPAGGQERAGHDQQRTGPALDDRGKGGLYIPVR